MRIGISPLGLGVQRPSSGGAPPALILDSLSAGAAYSVSRKLRTAHALGAIRVERDTDSAQTDIGYTGAGQLDEAALLAFSPVGSAFITTMYDNSANLRHVTQATRANMPRIVNAGVVEKQNGKPSAFFNGTSHHLFNTSPFMYAAGAATVMVVASGGTQLDRRIVSEGNSASANAIYSFITGANTGTSTAMYVRNDAGSERINGGDGTGVLSTGVWDNTLRAVAWRDNGTAPDGYNNGTIGTTRAYTRVDPTTLNRFSIGALVRAAAGNFFSGYMSEVIVFGSSIANADFNAVGASQGAAYGITVNPI